MDTKPWYASKTIWANLVALVAALATAAGLDLGLDTEAQATIVAGVIAVVNVGLRLVTARPIGRGGNPVPAIAAVLMSGLVLGGCAASFVPWQSTVDKAREAGAPGQIIDGQVAFAMVTGLADYMLWQRLGCADPARNAELITQAQALYDIAADAFKAAEGDFVAAYRLVDLGYAERELDAYSWGVIACWRRQPVETVKQGLRAASVRDPFLVVETIAALAMRAKGYVRELVPQIRKVAQVRAGIVEAGRDPTPEEWAWARELLIAAHVELTGGDVAASES
jgi:hypothetical protein